MPIVDENIAHVKFFVRKSRKYYKLAAYHIRCLARASSAEAPVLLCGDVVERIYN